MPRIFRTRTFSRWMQKAGLVDDALYQAACEMAEGLVDADLGGNILKKRVALPGRGKRGGARTIVATNLDDRWFFVYGFGKNERANITKDELKVLQEVAKELLGFDQQLIAKALSSNEIVEVLHAKKRA